MYWSSTGMRFYGNKIQYQISFGNIHPEGSLFYRLEQLEVLILSANEWKKGNDFKNLSYITNSFL